MTCRCAGDPATADDEVPAGRRLYEALSSVLAAQGAAAPVALRPVVCLANCDHGCTATVSQPGKWSYLLGRLDPEKAEDLLTYCATYAASDSGVVFRSRRPASLHDAIIGRVPSHTDKEAAE